MNLSIAPSVKWFFPEQIYLKKLFVSYRRSCQPKIDKLRSWQLILLNTAATHVALHSTIKYLKEIFSCFMELFWILKTLMKMFNKECCAWSNVCLVCLKKIFILTSSSLKTVLEIKDSLFLHHTIRDTQVSKLQDQDNQTQVEAVLILVTEVWMFPQVWPQENTLKIWKIFRTYNKKPTLSMKFLIRLTLEKIFRAMK